MSKLAFTRELTTCSVCNHLVPYIYICRVEGRRILDEDIQKYINMELPIPWCPLHSKEDNNG